MEVLWSLTQKKLGNQFLVVITDQYSKLTRAIQLRRQQRRTFGKYSWIIGYSRTAYRYSSLHETVRCSLKSFFLELCSYLGVEKLEKTAYHPQTNGQKERYNKNIMKRMRHYVPEHQPDYYTYTQPIAYAYKKQVHRSTELRPF